MTMPVNDRIPWAGGIPSVSAAAVLPQALQMLPLPVQMGSLPCSVLLPGMGGLPPSLSQSSISLYGQTHPTPVGPPPSPLTSQLQKMNAGGARSSSGSGGGGTAAGSSSADGTVASTTGGGGVQAAGRVKSDEANPLVSLQMLAELDADRITLVQRIARYRRGRKRRAEEEGDSPKCRRPEGAGAAYMVLHVPEPSRECMRISTETSWFPISPAVEETYRRVASVTKTIILLPSFADQDHCFMGYAVGDGTVRCTDDLGLDEQADLPHTWKSVVQVSWLRMAPLLHRDCNIRDKTGTPVSQASDGEILDPSAGAELCDAIDTAASALARRAPPRVCRKATHGKAVVDVATLTHEEYVYAVLAKRRQQLAHLEDLRVKASESPRAPSGSPPPRVDQPRTPSSTPGTSPVDLNLLQPNITSILEQSLKSPGSPSS
eukprot:Sspe_Gene.68834::Locus_40578_Transcript_1_1_Confidence_1.000_Length_1361::g.68834::m.68834